MNSKILVVLFLFVGHFNSLSARNTYETIELRENNFAYGYNSQERNYYIFYYNRYYAKHEDSTLWKEHPISLNEFPSELEFGKIKYIEKNGKNYFIHSGGGAVYTHTNNSIRRIDNSDDYKLQFNSYRYVKDDTLFNLGGYGYFNNYDKILYFDESRNNEWFLYETENYIPDASNMFLIFHDKKREHIYYFGGIYDVNEKVVSKKNSQYSIFRFSTNQKKWETLGNIDMQSSNRVDYIYNYHNSRGSRAFKFFDENFLYVLILDKLYTFDFRENFFTLSDFKIDNIATNLPIVYNQNKDEVMYITKFEKNSYPQVKIMKMDDFIPKNYREKHYIYSTVNSSDTFAIIFVALSILVGLFYWRKIEALFVDKSLQINNEDIMYGGKNILIFDDNEKKIIQSFLLKKYDVCEDFRKCSNCSCGVGTHELFDHIENGSQSFDNKRKKLSLTLHSLDIKLRGLSNINEEMIVSSPSKEDNRLRNYTISEKLFI